MKLAFAVEYHDASTGCDAEERPVIVGGVVSTWLGISQFTPSVVRMMVPARPTAQPALPTKVTASNSLVVGLVPAVQDTPPLAVLMSDPPAPTAQPFDASIIPTPLSEEVTGEVPSDQDVPPLAV